MIFHKFTSTIGSMILRLLEQTIYDRLQTRNKLLIIYGPRQAGKTTLLKKIQSGLESEKRIKYLNCDIEQDRDQIDTDSLITLKNATQNQDMLLIDEAQRLKDPGLTLKIIYDNIPDLRVIATGSSSFELKNRLSDALTGRYFSFSLYPLSWLEVVQHVTDGKDDYSRRVHADKILDDFLLYGFYPDVIVEPNISNKQMILSEILDSSLFKDILEFQRIKGSRMISSLCQVLSYQIGSIVNEHELSKRLEIDRKTVQHYLDLLEQTFVIFRVHPFSQNPRREIGRGYKVYFTDLGIRNALIGDFNPIKVRSDIGGLWENFIISERIKIIKNQIGLPNYHFWRSYRGSEIDWLEKPLNKDFQAYELKYGDGGISKGARLYAESNQYPISLINQETYHDFLSHP